MAPRNHDAPPPGEPAGAELPDFSGLATLLYGSRYELLSLIGVGGGGSVYRARDVELGELVALKVLRKELLSSPEIVERFRNEVRLSRRVTHRNVARVFDIGEHEGEKFLTMELIDGEPLTRRIAAAPDGSGRPMPLATVVDLIDQICAGLGAAHASGVVHCDLKPDNILITRDGQGERAVITDFGIARALAGAAPAGEEGRGGRFDGTPLYVSPEQVEGGRLDARSDLYSLGVVLYEMLTGTPPFNGPSTVAVVAARVLRPPPELQAARPDLPAAVAQVVRRCLAREPGERFQSAGELASALRQAAAQAAAEPTRIFTAAGPAAVRPSIPSLISVEEPAAEAPATPLATASPARRIAVLPLGNQGLPEDNYLAEGLTQDLIDTLAALPVRVYSRGAVGRFTGDADALVVGRELNVELVIQGTLRRVGERVRIVVRIVNVADGLQIFSQRFDYHPAEVLQLGDALCAAVADALTLKKAPPRQIPDDANAVEWYLRARHLYGLADRHSLEESVRLFERVLALTPEQPSVLLSYALAVSRLWFFGDVASAEKARQAAMRAVASMPERGEPHLALAAVRFQSGDLPEAVRSLGTALRLAPDLADAHELLGRILVETGPVKEGMARLGHARTLDPTLVRTLVDRARVLALLGEFEQAHQLLADPQIEGRFAVPWFTRARFCLWARDAERARLYLRRLEPERGLYARAYLFLRVVAERGQVDPREVLVEGLGSDHGSARGRIFFHQVHAELFSFFRQTELAVRSLARSVDAGLTDLLWLDRCPLIVALAADRRVASLRGVVLDRAAQVRQAAR